MKPPLFDFGDYADQFQGDIWGLTPHFHAGCRVLDIGANRGLVTAFCAVNGAFVTAYEVHPDAYKSLLQAIKINQVEHLVQTVNVGVWTHTGTARFDRTIQSAVHYANSIISERSPHDYFTDPITAREQIAPTVSFKEAIGEDIWDIVKMDIEGAEYPILLECPESVFDHIRFLTVETHPYLGTEREDLLDRLGKHFDFEKQAPIFAVNKRRL